MSGRLLLDVPTDINWLGRIKSCQSRCSPKRGLACCSVSSFSSPLVALRHASWICYCSPVMLDSLRDPVRDEMYIYITTRTSVKCFPILTSSSKPYRNQHSCDFFQNLPSFISIFRSITQLSRALSLEKPHHVVEQYH